MIRIDQEAVLNDKPRRLPKRTHYVARLCEAGACHSMVCALRGCGGLKRVTAGRHARSRPVITRGAFAPIVQGDVRPHWIPPRQSGVWRSQPESGGGGGGGGRGGRGGRGGDERYDGGA